MLRVGLTEGLGIATNALQELATPLTERYLTAAVLK
jgi:hypothetical protein